MIQFKLHPGLGPSLGFGKPPKPQKVKRMTIAAGFVCHDGIVMCADSQESAGDLKWPVEKLVVDYGFDGNAVMIAGAGFGSAIDTAAERIKEKLWGGFDQNTAVQHVNSILRDIIDNDLANYPTNDRGVLCFELLIAIKTKDSNTSLLHSDGSLVKRVTNFRLLGTGSLVNFFAHSLYRKTGWNRPILGISEGKMLAAYLIHLAKSQLSSVGGRSQIATLTFDGKLDIATNWEVPTWERFFTEFWWEAGKLMLWCADTNYPAEEFKKILESFSMTMMAGKEGLIREREEWERIFQPVTDGIKEKLLKPSASQKSKGQQ